MSLFRSVTEMPWLNPGLDEENQSYRFSPKPVKRVGLTVFLGVVTSMFFLFIVSYVERMELGDWNPVAEPFVLWINTALLIAASITMQIARNQAARDVSPRLALSFSGLFAVAFLLGQLLAWKTLADQGYYNMANPAFAFFIVLTALHGLHLLGGVYVWVRTMQRGMAGAEPADLGPTIELCAIYWHYLLVLWVVLFVLMLTY